MACNGQTGRDVTSTFVGLLAKLDLFRIGYASLKTADLLDHTHSFYEIPAEERMNLVEDFMRMCGMDNLVKRVKNVTQSTFLNDWALFCAIGLLSSS